MNLVEFLLARIAEDEADARSSMPGTWTAVVAGMGQAPLWAVQSSGGYDVVNAAINGPTAVHIARHDPARVLAECAAKRRIVAGLRRLEAEDYSEFVVGGGWDPGVGYAADAYEHALRALALPYADHPDYQQEWKP